MTNRGLLGGVKVVELGTGIPEQYCGKILANFGAEVVKVEPTEGDLARWLGPFPNDEPDPEKSGLFLALNVNKFGITLDVSQFEDVDKLIELLSDADVFICDTDPRNTDVLSNAFEKISSANPALITTCITPFGLTGPYSKFKGTDLTLFHMSAHAQGVLGPVDDPENDPPIRAGGRQSEMVSGMSAATATVMAIFRKRSTGEGSFIDASSFAAMATQLAPGLSSIAHGRSAPPRDQNLVREAATGGVVSAVGGVLPCADGYVAISPREDAQWGRWVDLMGNPPWASEERFTTREGREANFSELWSLVGDYTKQHSKHDIARRGQDTRIPCFPVNTVHDLFNDEHLKHREFFVEIEHPKAGMLSYPGVPYKISNGELPLAERSAPMLGQHNSQYFEGN